MAENKDRKGKNRKSGSSEGKSVKMEAAELTLEVGMKEAEKNDTINLG